MKLGIIQGWDEAGFQYAASKGLYGVEFCVNAQYDTEEFSKQVPQIQSYIQKYGVAVGSMGRWGQTRIDENGKIIESALQDDKRLIDAASALGCPVYNVGCNRTEGKSFEENCQIAIDYFAKLLAYAEGKNVKIATVNCDSVNFVLTPKEWSVIHTALPTLGIKYDPSHCVSRNGDYLKEMLDWCTRFYHFHIKGTLYIDGEHYDDPPAGLDEIHWGPVMNILYTQGYNGMLSIEPHSGYWKGAMGQWGIDFTIRYIRSMLMPDDLDENSVSPYMP